MINDVLEFISKRAIEVMIAKRTETVDVQLTPNTSTNAIDLKIGNSPFSKKANNLGAQLTKQNLGFLMDTPINFSVTSSVVPNSSEFEELWQKGDNIRITVQPRDEYAENFFAAYSKTSPTVEFSAKEIPKFENPTI